LGYPCPERFNPADHYIYILAVPKQQVGQGSTSVDPEQAQVPEKICDAFPGSEAGRELDQRVQAAASETISPADRVDMKARNSEIIAYIFRRA
jgi:hypothetical protein